MARTKKMPVSAGAQQEITTTENTVKESGITLSVTLSAEQYAQVLHICEVCGFSSVDEWFDEVMRLAI